jgi:colicin import membrane protein
VARKLKTYITISGFFDLAVAAPSMKAALEIWGSSSNIFRKGFAHETEDVNIVKATLEHPGVVLRRPVGSNGLFTEHADLPKLSVLKDAIRHKSPQESIAKKPKKNAVSKRKKADTTVSRKAAQLYDLAEKRREREEERTAAAREKALEQQERAMEKAEAARDEARARHDKRLAGIEKQRNVLDDKARLESERWEKEELKLKADLQHVQDEFRPEKRR